MTTPRSITIRRATAGDAPAVERLAQLEGVRLPSRDLLVADVDGELWAAVELGRGAVIADPFRPSGNATEMLRLRVEQLHKDRRRPNHRGALAGLRALPRRA